MTAKARSKRKVKDRAKKLTSVINRCLSLDQERIKGFISEHIPRLIRIYIVCRGKDERAWDLFYDMIFLVSVTTRNISQCQLLWLHHRSRRSCHAKWRTAIRLYMRQMFDKTCDQLNHWRWENPLAFEDQVHCSNPETTSLRKVKRTGECFSVYSSNDRSWRLSRQAASNTNQVIS